MIYQNNSEYGYLNTINIIMIYIETGRLGLSANWDRIDYNGFIYKYVKMFA